MFKMDEDCRWAGALIAFQYAFIGLIETGVSLKVCVGSRYTCGLAHEQLRQGLSAFQVSQPSLLLSSLELSDTNSMRLRYGPASEPLQIDVK